MPSPPPCLRASVIVPARDETATICAALDALGAQLDLNGEPLCPRSFEILLLCNNCRDDTASRARAWGKCHPHVQLHVVEADFAGERACVGHARRMAMNAACHRLLSSRATEPDATGPSATEPRAICSTDADTRVSVFWVAHILEEFRLGADAVGGRILLAPEGDSATRKTYLLDTAYRLLAARLESKLDPQPGDPWPRHFQFFGASLAIAPEVYAAIGGLPRARCLEDMALEAELTRRDLVVRRSPNVLALTSARRDGRVGTGLSTQLDEWAQADEVWKVPSGAEIAWRVQLKRRLRALFFARDDGTQDAAVLAAALLLRPAVLEKHLRRARTFGELWGSVWELAWSNPVLRAQWPPVAVTAALEELRAMLCGVNCK